MDAYIQGNGQSPYKVLCQGLFAEHLTVLGLQPLIRRYGFTVMFAPPSLEHGREQPGMDILLCDSENMTYLGIDVKMRRSRDRRYRDRFGWNELVKSPFVYLSLGDWSTPLPDGTAISFSDWMRLYSIPFARRLGAIPYLHDLRTYLVTRIEQNLNAYYDWLRRPDRKQDSYNYPGSDEDLKLLQEKLSIVQSLFADLNTIGKE